MWNSGPACIDSQLTFFAHLRSADEDSEPSGSFIYFWTTDFGEPHVDKVVSDSNANLTKLFSRFQVSHSGQYSIDVLVLNGSDPGVDGLAENSTFAFNMSISIAQATNNFTLTGKVLI